MSRASQGTGKVRGNAVTASRRYSAFCKTAPQLGLAYPITWIDRAVEIPRPLRVFLSTKHTTACLRTP
jgi:hypothetical protein